MIYTYRTYTCGIYCFSHLLLPCGKRTTYLCTISLSTCITHCSYWYYLVYHIININTTYNKLSEQVTSTNLKEQQTTIMMYFILMFMSLLVSVGASVSMPTSMPSSINYETLSRKSTIEQHIVEEEVGDMPSIALAPSMQPTNYEQTTSLLSNPTTMQPLDQRTNDLPLIKSSIDSPTTRPSHYPTLMSSPFRSSLLSSQKRWERFNWLLPAGSSGHSSCLMSQIQNSCFVSTFHWSKYRTTTANSSPAPKRIQTCNNPMLHPKKQTSITTRSLWSKGGNNIDLEDTNKGQQLFLLPLAMYTIIPFIPSAVLSTLNDQYLTVKGQFNLAAASLLPNTPTDSLEYLSAQDIYNESMQKLFVLLLSKRLMLYFLATLATLYAGWRASSGVLAIRDGRFSGPGDHLDKLTEEVLKGKTSFGSTSSEEGKDEKKSDEDQLFATLVDDDVSNVSTKLALVLPLVLGSSLAFSYLLTVITPSVEESASNGSFQDLLSSSSYLSSLPSAAICLLFTAAEFRWLLPSSDKQQDSGSTTSTAPLLCVGNVLALAYVLLAYGATYYPTLNNTDLWPLQNGVNIALGATVARAYLPSFCQVQPVQNQSEQWPWH